MLRRPSPDLVGTTRLRRQPSFVGPRASSRVGTYEPFLVAPAGSIKRTLAPAAASVTETAKQWAPARSKRRVQTQDSSAVTCGRRALDRDRSEGRRPRKRRLRMASAAAIVAGASSTIRMILSGIGAYSPLSGGADIAHPASAASKSKLPTSRKSAPASSSPNPRSSYAALRPRTGASGLATGAGRCGVSPQKGWRRTAELVGDRGSLSPAYFPA
jgi:hypothetical protein